MSLGIAPPGVRDIENSREITLASSAQVGIKLAYSVIHLKFLSKCVYREMRNHAFHTLCDYDLFDFNPCNHVRIFPFLMFQDNPDLSTPQDASSPLRITSGKDKFRVAPPTELENTLDALVLQDGGPFRKRSSRYKKTKGKGQDGGAGSGSDGDDDNDDSLTVGSTAGAAAPKAFKIASAVPVGHNAPDRSHMRSVTGWMFGSACAGPPPGAPPLFGVMTNEPLAPILNQVEAEKKRQSDEIEMGAAMSVHAGNNGNNTGEDSVFMENRNRASMASSSTVESGSLWGEDFLRSDEEEREGGSGAEGSDSSGESESEMALQRRKHRAARLAKRQRAEVSKQLRALRAQEIAERKKLREKHAHQHPKPMVGGGGHLISVFAQACAGALEVPPLPPPPPPLSLSQTMFTATTKEPASPLSDNNVSNSSGSGGDAQEAVLNHPLQPAPLQPPSLVPGEETTRTKVLAAAQREFRLTAISPQNRAYPHARDPWHPDIVAAATPAAAAVHAARRTLIGEQRSQRTRSPGGSSAMFDAVTFKPRRKNGGPRNAPVSIVLNPPLRRASHITLGKGPGGTPRRSKSGNAMDEDFDEYNGGGTVGEAMSPTSFYGVGSMSSMSSLGGGSIDSGSLQKGRRQRTTSLAPLSPTPGTTAATGQGGAGVASGKSPLKSPSSSSTGARMWSWPHSAGSTVGRDVGLVPYHIPSAAVAAPSWELNSSPALKGMASPMEGAKASSATLGSSSSSNPHETIHDTLPYFFYVTQGTPAKPFPAPPPPPPHPPSRKCDVYQRQLPGESTGAGDGDTGDKEEPTMVAAWAFAGPEVEGSALASWGAPPSIPWPSLEAAAPPSVIAAAAAASGNSLTDGAAASGGKGGSSDSAKKGSSSSVSSSSKGGRSSSSNGSRSVVVSDLTSLVVPEFVPLMLVAVRGGCARGGFAPARLQIVVRPPLPLEGSLSQANADGGGSATSSSSSSSSNSAWDFNFESVFVPRAAKRPDGSDYEKLSLTDGKRLFDGAMEGHGAKVTTTYDRFLSITLLVFVIDLISLIFLTCKCIVHKANLTTLFALGLFLHV